ncbi:MAG: quinolinate synthase NadA [Anaerolineae bacterium]|nr:quinolinate synthase NadA [Anaerolineae bacterium]
MTEPDSVEQAAVERVRAARAWLGDQVVILGHHYQRDGVIQFADYVGDSFELSREAAKAAAKYIVFAGVHFMAESAAILGRDDQVVILPDLQAGCGMADMAALDQVFTAWDELSEALDGHAARYITPVTYMNSAANLKAFVGVHDGVVCTSSNARGVLEWAFGQREKVFFFPDQHLGRNTGRAMGLPLEQVVVWDPFQPRGGLTTEQIRDARVILWRGHCSVHMQFQPRQIDLWREREPGIKVIVHPECTMEVVDKADYSGSTAQIIKVIEAAAPGSQWAIGTEMHLVNRLKAGHPDKVIHLLSPFPCVCSTMYRISPAALAHVLDALIEGRVVNQIIVPDDVRCDAKRALDRMLAIPR